MSNTSLGIVLTIVGLVISIGLIVVCCRRRARPSPANSIESFQQLYFTKSSTPMKENQRVIERWSSMEQPTLTFYRVYMQDDPDEFYRPVSEERARASIEQSKAMEYTDVEKIFF